MGKRQKKMICPSLLSRQHFARDKKESKVWPLNRRDSAVPPSVLVGGICGQLRAIGRI